MMHFAFHVVLIFMLYKTVQAFSLYMKSQSNTIQMKATEQFSPPFFFYFF